MPTVQRLYTTRQDNNNSETLSLLSEINNSQNKISSIKIFNRYDIQGLSSEMLDKCKYLIFADPCTDTITDSLPDDASYTLAVEYLPGQYDQRADAAQQCAMLLLGFRPIIRTARIYLFYGDITNHEAIRKFLINPVESREAQLDEYSSLEMNYAPPGDVKTIEDFRDLHGLAMSLEDLECCRKYFMSEGRMPTLTEIKVLDTYWSDHCRHTTFSTQIDHADIKDSLALQTFEHYLEIRKELGYSDTRPVTLMDIATIGAKYLRHKGLLPDLVISDENNACTVRIKINGEDWLLLFKNETHNHPTEIEPFGGAATCIGGAIRDPLSGRAYVYQAMRITGASDPFAPTMPGKLPQRSIITKAAQGYSSYGNQIGLPTGLVDEIYHEGYKAKRLEVGAVIASVPERNVKRERPETGDVVLLLGGRTGRDGIGGATGSSVSHNAGSLETCGAEVQKGNAPEERKLQRLFRNPEFTRLIKKCNDFGAGGVSVAVGELAEGLDIDLDAVPLKYAGLDGTEIAVSESQERMAVVVREGDAELVKSLALSEDVQAAIIARVNDTGRMRMKWRGKEIVNLSREFIDSNGAPRHITISIPPYSSSKPATKLRLPELLRDLNVCSKQGLAERFDGTVGAHTVLAPFGGKRQRTPSQVMAAKICDESDLCSVMSWGFDPAISSRSPFDGAYIAVVESLCKLVASGCDLSKAWLTLQEYFGKPEHDPQRWGLPFGALLGALKAQLDFGVAAIGGKDSMSGSFMNSEGVNFDVPPTLISFAVSLAKVNEIISPEFKREGSHVILLEPEYDARGLPEKSSLLRNFAIIHELRDRILACYVPVAGGIPAAVFKMCLGNELGFEFKAGRDTAGSVGRGEALSNIRNDKEAGRGGPDETLPNMRAGGITEHDEVLPNTHDDERAGGVSGEALPDMRARGITELDEALPNIHDDRRAKFIIELEGDVPSGLVELGRVTGEPVIVIDGQRLSLSDCEREYDAPLSSIFPVETNEPPIPEVSPKIRKDIPSPAYSHEAIADPQFIIPVFAGTNCEYETARAVERSGGKAKIFVVKTLTPDLMKQSAEDFAKALDSSQGLILPGGFSNGDEPDGSGKFIAIFLRSPAVRKSLEALLDDRGGLICGICNGFQALVKTGLLPYGRIAEPEELKAALTFNRIGRHQSRIIRARILTNHSAWLSKYHEGDVYSMPISHGEGRFICDDDMFRELMTNGQIAAQYVDLEGNPSMRTEYNPSGSCYAVECITSPDGRILGRMGHAERVGDGLYRNVPGNYDLRFFEGACDYFRKI